MPSINQIVRELIDQKQPLVLADLPNRGEDRKVHLVIFARSSATVAARSELSVQGGVLIDLHRLYDDLAVVE